MATRDVGNLRTKLSWEGEDANKSLTGFRRDLRGLKSEMELVKSKGQDYTRSLKGMKSQTDVLNRTFKTQQERVKELKRRYDESVRVKGEDSKQTQNLAIQYNKATAEMNRTEEQLKNLNAEIRRLESPWTKLGDVMTNTGDKMQNIGRSMSDFGRNYSLRVTTPIVAGGVAFFKAAMDYESAFAGVRKTVSMSEAEFATLSTGIRNMAKELPTAATNIAAVAEQAGQLGIENDNILAFTRTIIDLSESTNLTAEQAGTEFARFANIVGMSQKDFDRLGSSVVSLGNSMETTEQEIVSMGMRLAAQGNLVGMTEAQIMALAATMSSLGIEAEAGGTAMTMVLKKIEAAVDDGGKSLAGFAKASGVSSQEFKKAWENDAVVALDLFVKGLSKSSKEGENLTSILSDLGIKGIRESDTILRMAGASDLLSEAVGNSTNAWKENTALTNEAAERYKTTESQIKITWNRIKDMAITLGETLAPAVLDAIDAAEPLIKQIESGAKAFSEMDKEQQETIIKMIALAAAVGPASLVLGNLTAAMGGVIKAGGGVAKMLGKAGGAGMLGRLGMLAPLATSPVGLAILGVGGLTIGTYALSKAMEVTIQDTLKSIEARKAEIETTDELIASFEELQKKNKLSSDEMLRYMDIMTELEKTESEKAIKKLTDEQAELLKKSGLTNEEMERFLELNGKIVEKTPESSKAVSDLGNAYAATLDELKSLNEAERQRLADDTYLAVTRELDAQKRNLEEQAKLQRQIGDLEKERSSNLDEVNNISIKIREQDQYILGLKEQIKDASWQEQKILEDKLLRAQQELLLLIDSRKEHESTIDKIDKQIGKKVKSLEKTEKELEAFDQLKDEYEQMILFQAGLTAEKGKGVEKIKEEQKAIDSARKKLEEQRKAQEISTKEYGKQNEKLIEQQKKLDEAKNKLGEINTLAGKTVYKDVNLKTNPSVDSLNRSIGGAISKGVNLALNYMKPPSYAVGTDYHPGGPALTGEEGQELARIGNRWSMLGFGVHDLPRGTQVYTHDETKKIIRSLNKLPAYANGVSPSDEADKIARQLNDNIQQDVVQPAPIHVAQMVVREEADVKKVARELFQLQKGNRRVVLG